MIWQLNKTLTIPFLVLDTYSTPITSGVTPTCTIRRKLNGQYWRASDNTWQSAKISNNMTHSYDGIWVLDFPCDIEDQFFVRCSETTTKTEGGLSFSTSTNLNNSDVKTSTRSTVTESSIWNFSGRTLTSFGSLVNDIAIAVWSHSSRLLTGFSNVIADIWNYSNRHLSPSNVQGLGSCELSITLANGINTEIYNNLKQPLFQGVSQSSNIRFYVPPGEYYLIYSKSGFFTKQEKLIIPNVNSYLHSVELSPIVNTQDLNIKIRELPTKTTIYSGETLKCGLELYSDKSFNITSATASLGTVEIVGKKVFTTIQNVQSGNLVIEFDVVVGGNTITHRISKKVI